MRHAALGAPEDASPSEPSMRTYGVIIAVLVIVSAVAGGFGESYVPAQLIVGNDPAATARNISGSVGLYRLALVSYLLEAVCDVSLTVALYGLVRRVQRDLALVAVLTRFLGTVLFAAAELFFVAPLVIAGQTQYLNVYSADQLDVLAVLMARVFAFGSAMANTPYGIGTALNGVLIVRSGRLPRWTGALLAIGGVGFAASSIVALLAPTIGVAAVLIPSALATLVAMLALSVWLIGRPGVRPRRS